MKMYLSGALTRYDKPDEEEVMPLKTNSMYRVITSKTLKFLDVMNFLAAGVSLDSWLKAYKCSMTKGFFPYEWLDSYINYIKIIYPAVKNGFQALKVKISVLKIMNIVKTYGKRKK
jgi:hypothetical protein